MESDVSVPPVRTRLLRPQDLLSLEVQAVNLRLDTRGPDGPRLVRTDGPGDALLVIRIPPQSIAEEVEPEGNPDLPAGTAQARISGESRLVFRLPDDVDSVPYTTAGLLEWSQLEPVLTPVARPGPGERPAEPPPITAPDPLHTAVEMPYRLVLSPDSRTSWRSNATAADRNGRTELWHARLVHRPRDGQPEHDVTARAPAPARAIWSPDHAGAGVLPDPDPILGEPGFLTALTRRDRQELVELTSDFGGLEVPGTFPSSSPAFAHQIRFRVERYRPEPAEVDLWLLSALGGWLRAHGSWGEQPAQGTDESGRPRYSVNGQVLGLSSWRHQSSQGRDHFVEVVYEGSLFPVRHRAAWVTVTERRFETGNSGPPVARLRQFNIVIVRQAFRSYDGAAYPGQGREMPLQAGIRLLTHSTPHVLGPFDAAPPGRQPLIPGTQARWVRTQDGVDFPFGAVGTDADGGTVNFAPSLIWVPDEDASAPDAAARMAAVRAAYASGPPASVPGDSMAFAPGSTPGARDAALPTFALRLDAHLSGGDFVPLLAQADVRLKPVEAVVGPGKPVTVKPFPGYVTGGIDAYAGVFAELVTGAPVRISADKAGGLATPNVTVSGVGRAAGVVSGDLAHAAQGVFDPKAVFAAADAQLFGSVRLSSLLPLDAGGLSAAANAPRLHTFQESGPGGLQTVTVLEWAPAVVQPPGGIIAVDAGTTLTVNARIVQPLGAPGTPVPPPSFSVTGVLSGFRFVIPDIVSIGFRTFSFRSASGQKLDVSVDMGGNPAVQFLGPLEFVTELARRIPAGIFGADGPSLDVEPDHVTVGAGVALPPLAVGVFSLQNLAIGAAVTLPFLDGKPLVDVSFASRDKPFLLTVTLFGGGGFVHVQLDSDGVRMVEGSLEFGGSFALDIGVASGGVQVMAGIYFKLSGPKSLLAGFVDVCGEVSVLGLISVSVDFNLTLSYESPGTARGRATLMIAVHLAFISKSVELSVERSFSSDSGDPSTGDVMSAEDWSSYAGAFG